MWPLIDRLSRPTLQQFLLGRADAYRRLALEARAGFDPADPARQVRLAAACHGLAACWQALGPGLPEPLRGRVRHNRRALERLLRPWPDAASARFSLRLVTGLLEEARGAHARRSVLRLLTRLPVGLGWAAVVDLPRFDALLAEQARLLDSLQGCEFADAELRSGLARTYRKARRALRRNPSARRTCQRVGRLVGVAELIHPAAGRTSSDAPPGLARAAVSGRDLLCILREMRELDALRRRLERGDRRVEAGDRKRLLKLIRRRARRLRQRLEDREARGRPGLRDVVFGATGGEFEAGLRWSVFAALATALGVQGGTAGESPGCRGDGLNKPQTAHDGGADA